MKEWIEKFKLVETEPYYLQIERHVRGLIEKGRLTDGEKLPPMRELAHWYGVDISTIQPALASLAREKLLLRYPKKGTFVRANASKLTDVAYFDMVYDPRGYASDFGILLGREIRRLLDARNLNVTVWSDSRTDSACDTPLEGLVDAIRQRRVQIIVAPLAHWPQVRWLSKLKVPCVFNTTLEVPNRVDIDEAQFSSLAVGSLAAQGCRSVGFITPMQTNLKFEGKLMPRSQAIFKSYLNAARDQGVATRDEWLRSGPRDIENGFEQERFGYDAFHALWDLPEHPEGIVVWPDSTARGVVAAMLERGVKAPRNVRLALHRNVEVPLLCPMEATYVLSSIREHAETMIRIMDQRFLTGKDVPPAILPFKLFRP